MHPHATAAILSVGDELTLGQTLDTNSRWLSERLTALGIATIEHTTIPDDRARHAEALRRLAARVDLVICTGGLGPTADDLTRHALADALSDALIEDALALAQIEAWFAARGTPMRPINRAQALRPARAASLPNPMGTAPGLFATLSMPGNGGAPPHTCDVFCLPGPPAEMTPMFEHHVVPRLRPARGKTIRTRALHCVGIGESELATRLGPLMDRDRNPLVGTTASGGIVSARIRYEGPLAPDLADAELDAVERRVRDAAGAHIFGAGDATFPAAIVHALKSRGGTLALAESCTGGRLAALITNVPGSSAVLSAGWVAYSIESKQRDLGLDAALFARGGAGAYSTECAAAMAQGALARANTSFALGVTGIAGPEGGTPAAPVGSVWIALAAPGQATDTRRFNLLGDRHAVREWASLSALAMLWLHLSGHRELRLLRQAAP